ncbi:PRK06851 family protein [Desulfitobacterium hafniense]|uniref:PRK06851 family protein n=1 Tax=Desulfitobacterium hafniense TaxID=49338 RepID=UPI00037E42A8|nr:PRK06851 family protein [Desulfitobacterium hafniense]
MAKNPVIRKMFPGGVTYLGFYSYYHYLADATARHIYVIKGGPGVGKSTFMKKIGEEMLKAGFDLEYHCCSSDNQSIDGIVIPELGIALLDGTAPHVVDPKIPGAVDEIINLGEYWDESLIRPYKKEIIACSQEIGRCFESAYFALKDAKNAMDEWEFYIKPDQDWQRINQIYLKTKQELFKAPSSQGTGKTRHLFAWAHTPQGRTQHIDSLIQGMDSLYSLKGQAGTGKSTLLARLAEEAEVLNYDLEIYHNALEPDKIDLLLIPELHTALVISSEHYPYHPEFSGTLHSLDLDSELQRAGLSGTLDFIDSCRNRVEESILRAQSHSQRAKTLHDQLEQYYIPAMDFQAIDEKRRSILKSIMENYS